MWPIGKSLQPGALRILDPHFAAPDEEIVGIGDDLSTETLLWAYGHGVFPWPIEGLPLVWFCPPERAVLEFSRLHVPRRLARIRRHSPYTFTIDRAFGRVMAACQAAPRPGQEGTWITDSFIAAYNRLHRLGFAHSAEAWDASGELAGGLYGVSVGGAFSGESMFHAAPNASKLALLHLVDHLAARRLDWIDIQVMTPHFAALGASLIPRAAFLDRLEATQQRRLQLWATDSAVSPTAGP